MMIVYAFSFPTTELHHDIVFILEKCRHCGASLSDFADAAHGRAYAVIQTHMYMDVGHTYVRKLCVESALPSAL